MAESVTNPCVLMRRDDYLKWDEYFIATAYLASRRSKNPNKQVGACIAEPKPTCLIVGVGYNGFPRGCHDADYPWNHFDTPLYEVHAEVNAILNKNTANLKGTTMYVTHFPCCKCAQMIIQSGIKRVVYMSEKDANTAEVAAIEKMFKSNDITHMKWEPTNRRINFTV